MQIRHERDRIIVSGSEAEVNDYLRSTSFHGSVTVVLQIGKIAPPEAAGRATNLQDSTGTHRGPATLEAFLQSPDCLEVLGEFVAKHPNAGPADFVNERFGGLPGFGAHGRYLTVYTSLYGRMRTARMRAGLPASLKETRGSPTGQATPRDRKRGEGVFGPAAEGSHVSQKVLRPVVEQAARAGLPLSVETLITMAYGNKLKLTRAERKRVGDYFWRLRKELEPALRGTWRAATDRSGRQVGTWTFVSSSTEGVGRTESLSHRGRDVQEGGDAAVR